MLLPSTVVAEKFDRTKVRLYCLDDSNEPINQIYFLDRHYKRELKVGYLLSDIVIGSNLTCVYSSFRLITLT